MRTVIVWAQAAVIALALHSPTNANELYITQTGNGLTLQSSQNGPDNLADITLNGNNQTIKNMQVVSVDTADYHWLEMVVYGDNTYAQSIQTHEDNKYSNINIDGDNNNIFWEQRDSGPHTGFVSVTGDGHRIYGEQKGSGNHYAEIDITNGGGSYDIDFLQDGSTDQSYTLFGTCTNANGCALTVTQQ